MVSTTRVHNTNIIYFVPKGDVPKNHKVTCVNFVCDNRPLKSEPYHLRLTVGGDRLDYDEDSTSLASYLLDTKFDYQQYHF